MPTYCYEHEGAPCKLGQSFHLEQRLGDAPLAVCPECGGAVYKVMQPVNISAPQSDSDLRSKGFTKLVRRDKGVYENVTALDGESRYVHAGRPETMPDFDRRHLDGV
ncbi:MAG: zinc ribbon domain-containing protein [Planctomycetes bacterium]|nr:zinc ribbon domain-containing protein [Planctomycetota bacterium]